MRVIYLLANNSMSYKYLPILLLLIANTAYADITTTTNANAENSNLLVMPASVMPSIPSAYSRGGGRRATLYSSIELGYGGSSSSIAGVKSQGGGFIYKIELGVKVLMPTRFATRYNFFSVGFDVSGLSSNEHYKDTTATVKTKYQFTTYGLPISYCSIDNPHTVGFYWQIGVNLNYLDHVQTDNSALMTSFNKFGVEPCVSPWMSIIYEYRDRTFCALIGLYGADMVTNIAKENGATMHFYSVGIKYTSVRM